jgi:hypothetical protein
MEVPEIVKPDPINVNHQPGEGPTTKRVMVLSYIIALIILAFAILALVVSLN